MTESSARNADIRKDLLHIPTATRQQQGIDDIEHARAGHEHKIFEFVAQYLEFKEAWRVDEVQALESVLLPQGAGHWSRSRYCRRRPISISLSVCPLHASTNLHIPAVPRSEFPHGRCSLVDACLARASSACYCQAMAAISGYISCNVFQVRKNQADDCGL